MVPALVAGASRRGGSRPRAPVAPSAPATDRPAPRRCSWSCRHLEEGVVAGEVDRRAAPGSPSPSRCPGLARQTDGPAVRRGRARRRPARSCAVLGDHVPLTGRARPSVGRDPDPDAPADEGRRHRVVGAEHAHEGVLAGPGLEVQIGVGQRLGQAVRGRPRSTAQRSRARRAGPAQRSGRTPPRPPRRRAGPAGRRAR